MKITCFLKPQKRTDSKDVSSFKYNFIRANLESKSIFSFIHSIRFNSTDREAFESPFNKSKTKIKLIKFFTGREDSFLGRCVQFRYELY